MSVLRYAERTREPLVVDDATRDDRFARDPYFAGSTAARCWPCRSSAGPLRAVLLLENRLIRGAFTADRLDAVKLIAGQLAVSLDNAQLYAELAASRARIVAAADQARRRIERDLHDGAQQRLVPHHRSPALELARRRAAERRRARPRGSIEQAPRRRARWRSCASSRAASIPRVLPRRPGAGARALARRSAVPVEFACATAAGCPSSVEVTAYFVVSEALTNAAKHARASRGTHRRQVDGDLRLVGRRRRRGGAASGARLGLVGLKDRVEALGGTLAVHSAAVMAPASRRGSFRSTPGGRRDNRTSVSGLPPWRRRPARGKLTA